MGIANDISRDTLRSYKNDHKDRVLYGGDRFDSGVFSSLFSLVLLAKQLDT